MGGKPAVEVRFTEANFFLGAISGSIDTLTNKLAAITELNTAQKWKDVFGVSRVGDLPETMMFFFNVGAVAATLGSNINSTVTTLPQSSPTPWFFLSNADKLRISGSIEIVMRW